MGTWSTDIGTEETKGDLSREHSPNEHCSRKEKKPEEKDKKKEEKNLVAQLDPEKDTTDPTPFREKPSRLAMLVDPKSLDDLEKIGGVGGLLEGLGVDLSKGLSAGLGEGPPGPNGEEKGRDASSLRGAQWAAGIEDRRKVYGRNDLPPRKSKSIWLLMWLAFKDKVLVRLLPSCLYSCLF